MSRSYRQITRADLSRLASIAASDRRALFARNPRLAKLYGQRVICVLLCQGAALHYVDGTSGVNDFDVWTFYRARPAHSFPPRRNMPHDFGALRFGKSPDRPHFVGRRVDCIGRSIPCRRGRDPFTAVRLWLTSSANPSPRHLAKKAAIVLEPARHRGKVVWP
ncbi:MAG: hypothetical protein HY713_13865 [candidate division NC10 bacterium]|nr:hypothetical protein [candidate division NC10 bacterium]